MKKTLLLLIFLLLPLATAIPTGYVLNDDNYVNVRINTTGLNINYTLNPQYIYNLTYWQVKHGLAGTYNISINTSCHYDSDTLVLRIKHYFHSGSSTGWSQPQCFNSTDWINIGTLSTGASSEAGAGSSSLMNDDDYTTGVQYDSYINSLGYSLPATSRAVIYEADAYFYQGIQIQDVVFTVKNEFGRPIEGAVVNLTRLTDNRNYGIKVTDLSGQVLFNDVNRDYFFNLTAKATGYKTFSGLVNVIDGSYTVTMVSGGIGGGTYYYGLFNNLTLITSPTANPSPVMTNFSININSTDNLLSYWGVRSVFNGTSYKTNNTAVGGGFANLTINLSGHSGQTILVSYFFKKVNTSLYSQNRYFIIGVPGSSNTSITGLNDDFNTGFSSAGKTFILMMAIILVVGLFSASGVPGVVSAIMVLPILITSAIFQWTDPVITGMSVMIIIGILIITNKDGL